ncbi:MAG: hypothetical protein ACOCUU_00115 [Nanoarchaeota archaeon]
MVKKAVLDTSFIISAVGKKIDFFKELEYLGFKILIPQEVLIELKGIAQGKKKRMKFRDLADTALKIIECSDFEEIILGIKKVDTGLVNYAKEDEEVYIGTLDKEIIKKLKGKTIILKGKRLEVV